MKRPPFNGPLTISETTPGDVNTASLPPGLNFPLSNNPAATDYMDRYQGEVAKNNELTERVAALEGQIAAMQGRERPRPPRPLN